MPIVYMVQTSSKLMLALTWTKGGLFYQLRSRHGIEDNHISQGWSSGSFVSVLWSSILNRLHAATAVDRPWHLYISARRAMCRTQRPKLNGVINELVVVQASFILKLPEFV